MVETGGGSLAHQLLMSLMVVIFIIGVEVLQCGEKKSYPMSVMQLVNRSKLLYKREYYLILTML